MAGVLEREKRENGGKEAITEILQANISDLKARISIVQQTTEDKGEDSKHFERAHTGHVQRTKNQKATDFSTANLEARKQHAMLSKFLEKIISNLEFHAESNRQFT